MEYENVQITTTMIVQCSTRWSITLPVMIHLSESCQYSFCAQIQIKKEAPHPSQMIGDHLLILDVCLLNFYYSWILLYNCKKDASFLPLLPMYCVFRQYSHLHSQGYVAIGFIFLLVCMQTYCILNFIYFALLMYYLPQACCLCVSASRTPYFHFSGKVLELPKLSLFYDFFFCDFQSPLVYY